MSLMNEMRLDFPAMPKNESFARLAVSAFILSLNPTIEQLSDVKTSVSEAVTNAIVHGYSNKPGTVRIHATLDEGGLLCVDIIDNGVGIADIEQARRPFFSTQAGDERSGMGFSVMESFMDSVEVRSEVGRGTCVRMYKKLDVSERLDAHIS